MYSWLVSAVLLASSALATPQPDYRTPMPTTSRGRRAPAFIHANLSPQQCRKRLQSLAASFRGERRSVRGIATPLRVSRELSGVHWKVPPRSSSFGLLDCRLALSLQVASEALVPYGVTEVWIDNFYRKNARVAGKHKRSQHRYGLAADITGFRLANGQVLRIAEDFGAIDRDHATCGADAPDKLATTQAKQLRDIVCAIARSGAFHHILTPNYNAAHKSHLHLDIERGNQHYSTH